MTTMTRRWLLAAAIFGATGVICGALAAHGLKGQITPERLAVWETAARYQLIHALALLFLSVLPFSRSTNLAGWSWTCGTLIFSGSLYLLVLSDRAWLGAITPIGGLMLISGWLALGWAAWKSTSQATNTER